MLGVSQPSRPIATAMTNGTAGDMGSNSNSLSKLAPAQTRSLREAFQILDRDSDNLITPSDILEMHTQLGLPSPPNLTNQFFPPGTVQSLSLPAFLGQISNQLAELSSSNELMAAFAAFDEEDSGQIDVAELREALLHTPMEAGEKGLSGAEVDRIVGEFSGRRAFGKGMGMGMGKRGEVFRYQEFVQAVVGGSGNGGGTEAKEEDE
jgi:Ca2+-binding EF-hand superfamily protein